jgi:hypothetical protein
VCCADLLERLQKVEEKEVTALSWRDTHESWHALIRLRTQISVERGHCVLDCICADARVLEGLGAARQLYSTIGDAPDELLQLINRGPGQHIRQNAYRYRAQIDRELVTIRRLKELQVRMIALAGSAILAAMVGLSNALFARVSNVVFPG